MGAMVSWLFDDRKLATACAGTAAALFAALFALIGTASDSPALPIVAALAHVVLYPVVAFLPGPRWAAPAGYAWLATDIASNVMGLNGVAVATTTALRLGGHLSAAVWIFSIAPLGRVERFVAVPLGLMLFGYSLVAPWVPEAAFYPAFILLLAWLVVVTLKLARKPHVSAAHGTGSPS